MKVLNDRGLVYQVQIIKSLFRDEESARDQKDDVLDQKIDSVKQEIEDELQNYATKYDLSRIPKFAIAVVSELPASNISPTTVYLVTSGNETTNLYTEYIYVNNKWEILGSQSLDLTGYATKDWVQSALQNYVQSSDVYSKTQIDTMLRNKSDKSDLQQFLPITGGELSGAMAEIIMGNGKSFISSKSDSLELSGGDTTGYDSRLSLGSDESGYGFTLMAGDGEKSAELKGKPNGSLTWQNNSIALEKDVLSLNGGKMKGIIYSNSDQFVDATSSTRSEETVYSGRDKNDKNLGSTFFSAADTDVFHGFRTSNPNINYATNWADIRLHVDSEGKAFITTDYYSPVTDGTQDNTNHIPTTSFIRKNYLPLIGGTLSGWLQFSNQSGRIQMKRSSSNNDGDLGIYGGSGYSTGSYLWLNGVGKASQAGYFGLRAVTDGSTYKELQGRPDGTLTWGGKQLGLQANTNNYVKLDNGQSYSFTFTSGMATIIAKSGNFCAMYVVDASTQDVVRLMTTDPSQNLQIDNMINEQNPQCRIINSLNKQVVLQIINSGIGW